MGSNVDVIKERLDIVEIISGYVKLEKAGTNFKARCPFHNEKAPSFYVSPSRQTYYCFGCGAKGDMFSFVEEIEGLDFRGALKLLAYKAGVELQYERPAQKTEKEKLEHILIEASNFFKTNLENSKEAQEYIKNRGLTEETIKKWDLGFIPDEWRLMYSHLVSIGYPKDLILKAGLAKLSDEKGKSSNPYDIFRGRIIFPIRDSSGKIVAFTGRALAKDAEPKYLNTPDTPLFKKSEILYGLDKAKEEIRKKDYTILVEGQIDLVLSHQAGVTNVVATSGTAFTKAHLERLKKLSQRIVLAFDGDSAGEKAIERSAVLAMSLGMEVKAVRLPEGSDPADIVRESSTKWKEILRQSKPIIEHLLDEIEKEADNRKVERFVKNRVLPFMLFVSPLEYSRDLSLISQRTSISMQHLEETLRKLPPPTINDEGEVVNEKEIKDKITDSHEPRKSKIERKLIGLIFWQEGLEMPMVDIASLKNEIIARTGGEYFKNLCESLEIERENLIFEAESFYGDPQRLPRDIVELLDNLADDLLREDLVRHIRELSIAEAKKDSEMVNLLSGEIQVIHSKMRALEEKRKVL